MDDMYASHHVAHRIDQRIHDAIEARHIVVAVIPVVDEGRLGTTVFGDGVDISVVVGIVVDEADTQDLDGIVECAFCENATGALVDDARDLGLCPNEVAAGAIDAADGGLELLSDCHTGLWADVDGPADR